MNSLSNSAEAYIPEPGEAGAPNAAPDERAHLVGVETVTVDDARGLPVLRVLGPWSIGLRALWDSISESTDRASFAACAIIWLRLRLQEEFDAVTKPREGGGGFTGSLEMAWMLAKSNLLQYVSGSWGHVRARADVLAFLEALGTRGRAQEIVRIATKTLTEAEQSEAEAEPSEPKKGGLGLGESKAAASRRLPSKSTRSKKKQGKGKKR